MLSEATVSLECRTLPLRSLNGCCGSTRGGFGMRSALALHEAVVDDPQDRDGISCDLLVLWRHPETGQIMPVGRLRYRDGIYTFAYVRAVLSIDRFRPLP